MKPSNTRPGSRTFSTPPAVCFFSSSGWFSPPIGDARDAVSSAIERLRGEAGRLERQIGGPVSAAVSNLAAAVDRFRTAAEESGITPKGTQVLNWPDPLRARRSGRFSLRETGRAGSKRTHSSTSKAWIFAACPSATRSKPRTRRASWRFP
jgi:hypothetical protein